LFVLGGQHDGHLPFWLPSSVKLITLLLHVLFAVAEINILLLVRPSVVSPSVNIWAYFAWRGNSWWSENILFHSVYTGSKIRIDSV